MKIKKVHRMGYYVEYLIWCACQSQIVSMTSIPLRKIVANLFSISRHAVIGILSRRFNIRRGSLLHHHHHHYHQSSPAVLDFFSVFGTQSGRGKLFLFPITHSHHTPNKLNFPFCWDLFTILATSLSFRLTTQESSQSDFGWTSEMRIIRRKVFAIEIIPNLFWEESVCEI